MKPLIKLLLHSDPQRILLIDLFVTAGLLTVFGTRAFLAATGYPQIGNDTLHIAHMLWGGFLLCGTVLYLLLAIKPKKLITCLLAGSGFGLFIDELGKFITNDNDYFFKPAAALIIILFIIIWIVSRWFITRADNIAFISPSRWPTIKLVSVFVLGWLAFQTISTVSAIIYFFRQPQPVETFTDKTSLPLAVGLLYVFFTACLTSTFYFVLRKKMGAAAHVLRVGLMFGIIFVYPAIFYRQQFAAAIGFTVSILLVLALSSPTYLSKKK